MWNSVKTFFFSSTVALNPFFNKNNEAEIINKQFYTSEGGLCFNPPLSLSWKKLDLIQFFLSYIKKLLPTCTFFSFFLQNSVSELSYWKKKKKQIISMYLIIQVDFQLYVDEYQESSSLHLIYI